MAVTIDDMQVDVRSDAPKGAQPAAAAPQPKEQEPVGKQMEMMTERALRLKTN